MPIGWRTAAGERRRQPFLQRRREFDAHQWLEANPNALHILGPPGSGKTALSQRLARDLKAVHLRIDTIEQGLRDLCG